MKVFDAWGLAMLLTHMNSADRQAQMDVLQGERDNQVPADFMQTFGIEGLAAQALHHAKVAGLPSTYDRVRKNGPFTLAIKGQITFEELRHQLEALQECKCSGLN